MQIRIRDAEPADLERIAELFRQLWPDKEPDFAGLSSVFRHMRSSDAYRVLCAEEAGKVTGFCSAAVLQNFWQDGPVLYITTMIVDQQRRRRGIGTAFLEELERMATERTCRRIELESAFHRADAHGFYEKRGFEKRAFFFSKQVK